MPFRSDIPNKIANFNKHGLYLRWPRLWIIILGLILVFLCFCIAGMEVGHTLVDLRRSTAFGGFIVFIPLLICAIFILITACKPRLILLRIATILCFIMIILCLALIAYDILVLIDPTRCFFLNCNDAVVNASNSTTNITVTGWPLTITWPNYFLINMNLKRIFQSIQILCACLFILFASLYILTYFIYRRINLHQNSIYNADQRTFIRDETSVTPIKRLKNTVQSYPQYNPNHLVTTYTIEGHSSSLTKHNSSFGSPVIHEITSRKTKRKTSVQPRAISVNDDRICICCMKEPRMILTTNFERQNFYSHLCANCNNELSNYRRKPPLAHSTNNRSWKP